MTKKFKKVPKHDFKLDCGDDPEVRQWLHDNGFEWRSNDSILTEFTNKKYITVEKGYCGFYSDFNNFYDDDLPLFNPYKKQLTDEQKLDKADKLEKKAQALRNEVAKKEVKQVLWVCSDGSGRVASSCFTYGCKPEYHHWEEMYKWHKVPTCTRLVKE